MATIRFRLCILVLFLFCSGWKSYAEEWLVEKHKGYTFYYSQDDRQNKAEYIKMVNKGIKEARSFFGDPYKSKFDVYIYHSREAMDKQWQLDWKMPDLKSECWMVASGVAHRLDVLSPKVWDKEACEHNYDDKQSTQEIFTHELMHVYHGQLNKSHDFSDVDRIDWFVEGLANFASGQCDEKTLQKIKLALTDNKIPESLDNFWTGNLRYGLSGSMVMYIDQAYGRKKLKELLKFNKKDEILSSLNVTETDLINGWKKMIGDITFPE